VLERYERAAGSVGGFGDRLVKARVLVAQHQPPETPSPAIETGRVFVLLDRAIDVLDSPPGHDLRPAFAALDALLALHAAAPAAFPPGTLRRLMDAREGADDRPVVVCDDLCDLRDELRAFWP
jgi:hypothetical protein